MPTHTIEVTAHELEVLHHILKTYETVLTNVRYRKWKRDEAFADLANMKLAVSKSRRLPTYQDA